MFSILIVVSVTSALVYGLCLTIQPPSAAKTIMKMLSVGGITAASVLSGSPLLLTIALIFGTLGDGFLSRSGDRNFLAGLASFLIGHICYIILFYSMISGTETLFNSPVRVTAAIALLATALGVSTHLSPHLGKLKLPVYAYVVASLVMGIAALMLNNSWPLLLVTFGAFLFILSDVVLAYDLFVISDESRLKKVTSRVLWFLYWGGQLLILTGVVQALA